MDGLFLPWADARLHVSTQAVLRGFNVFEGIRGYWSDKDDELWVFRLKDHLKRLSESMKVFRIALPYGLDVVGRACLELLRRCEFREDVQLRVVVYLGNASDPDDTLGVGPGTVVGSFILALPKAAGPKRSVGVHATVSSWLRISDRTMPPRVKAGANYLNGRFATAQAKLDGYDVSILLNEHGHVAELPGSCLMMVRRGRLVTPPVTDNILESITRTTVLELATHELSLHIDERSIDRTELYLADELFHCGTAEEITPIISADRHVVGSGARGDVTKAIQDAYFAAVRGGSAKYRSHLSATYREE